jgi:hypothetical protein
MKKVFAVFILSLTAFAFSALSFANNVVAVVKWWKAFLTVGGDGTKIAVKVPGFIEWLDWSVVDYSAVTTLIPTIGFFCMSVGAWRLLRRRRMSASDFPFFKGSDQLHIALGLFGTLWGIIVIGYYKLETVSMPDLMQCLHTALFSTLTAVVWVFMIDRPIIRPFFCRLLEKAGCVETEEGDLSAAVESLIVRLGEASDKFDERQKSYEEAFESRQKKYEDCFLSRHAEYEKAFEARLKKYESEFSARQKEYVEFFMRRIGELERRAEESEKRAEESDRKLKAVSEALRG